MNIIEVCRIAWLGNSASIVPPLRAVSHRVAREKRLIKAINGLRDLMGGYYRFTVQVECTSPILIHQNLPYGFMFLIRRMTRY